MDEESGILAGVQANDYASVNETNGLVTLEKLPITAENDSKPILHGVFKSPVTVTAVQVTLRSPTPSTLAESGEVLKDVQLVIAVSTTRARDTNVDTPSEELDAADPKVVRIDK